MRHMDGERRDMLTIISGGQTGVDRAALDAAVEVGVPYGGWCPKDGWAEDLPAPPGVCALYPDLKDTPTAAPEQRNGMHTQLARGCSRAQQVLGFTRRGMQKQHVTLAPERAHLPLEHLLKAQIVRCRRQQ